MKKNNSIKFNFIMNSLLTISSFIFPLITFPYVSRILLPEGTGKVSFVTSVVTYFNMFAQLGIPTYGIRACAKVRDDKEELTRTTQELVIINFVMSVISYTVLAVALMLVPRLREERATVSKEKEKKDSTHFIGMKILDSNNEIDAFKIDTSNMQIFNKKFRSYDIY